MRIAGSIVQRLRWSRGWGITDLAEHTGLGVATIARIESGESRGSPKSALKIAEALGCSVLDIVVDEGQPTVSGAVGQVIGNDHLIRKVG